MPPQHTAKSPAYSSVDPERIKKRQPKPKQAADQPHSSRVTPPPPSLESIRHGSTPRPAQHPITLEAPTTVALKNISARYQCSIDESQERDVIQRQWASNLQQLLTAFKTKIVPPSPINRKITDDPSHCNKDTLHTKYKTAILNNDSRSFHEILIQAHNIGTATRYFPTYRQNDLLVTSLERAVAKDEKIRANFVTTLLSLPQVQEELNKDKKTYIHILDILFRDDDNYIKALRKVVFIATTNKAFKLLFVLRCETATRIRIEKEEDAAFTRLLDNQNQLIAPITDKAMKDLSLLEDQNRKTIAAADSAPSDHSTQSSEVEAVNVVPFIVTEHHEAPSTEDQQQFRTFLTPHQTEAINALPSLEEKQRSDLHLQQQEMSSIFSKSAQEQSQKKLHTLGELCKQYLDYALDALRCDRSQGEPETSHDDESKRGKLINKYKFVKALYDITQKSSSDTGALLNEFTDAFHKSDRQTLLQTHRDNVFVQFIKSLWEIITLIPKAFGYLSSHKKYPGFWQPAQGKVLSDALEDGLKTSRIPLF